MSTGPTTSPAIMRRVIKAFHSLMKALHDTLVIVDALSLERATRRPRGADFSRPRGRGF